MISLQIEVTNYMKKQFRCLFTVLSLILSYTTPYTIATDTSSNTEHMVKNNSIVCEYVRNPFEKSLTTVSDVETLMQSLGMEKTAIQNLTEKDITRIGSASKITTITSYIKVDHNGNITYLSEQDINEELEAISNNNARKQDTYEDTYMRVWHAVEKLDDETYQMTSSARWLKMPVCRDYDMIGSCAQKIMIVPDSYSGYVSYDVDTVIAGTHSSSTYKKNLNEFNLLSDGVYTGLGSKFILKTDETMDGVNTIYSNCVAYLTFQSKLNHPSTTSVFTSCASYDHSRVSLSLSPSLEISASGSNIISVTFAKLDTRVDYRRVQLQVKPSEE